MSVCAGIFGAIYYFDRSPIMLLVGALGLGACWAALRGPFWD